MDRWRRAVNAPKHVATRVVLYLRFRCFAGTFTVPLVSRSLSLESASTSYAREAPRPGGECPFALGCELIGSRLHPGLALVRGAECGAVLEDADRVATERESTIATIGRFKARCNRGFSVSKDCLAGP